MNPAFPEAYSPVLVTGAAGFVGANLVRRLLGMGCEVHVLLRDQSRLWRLHDLLPRLVVHRAGMLDAAAVREIVAAVRPRVVYHLATFGAYETQADPQQILETNVLGTQNLLAACAAAKVMLFVNAGSSSEYGFKTEPMRETDRLEPNSYYAVAKAAQMHLCELAARKGPLAVVGFRLFSVYGPWEEPSRLIPTLIRRARANVPLEMVSPDTARDFVYIDDVVDAFVAVDRLVALNGAVLNLGTGVQTTMRQIVDCVRHALGSRSEVHWGKFKARHWDSNCWVADPARIRERLGWQPRFSLESAISNTVAWVVAEGEMAMSQEAARVRFDRLTEMSRTMRNWIVQQSHDSHVGHIGSALGIVDIVAALWGDVMHKPGTDDSARDRFVLCKGHAALAQYAAMRWNGLLDEAAFATYCGDGSSLGAHPEHCLPGVEVSTGSLGQGLSVACGLAFGLRLENNPARTFALVSDAECNEGQVWEAVMFAAHHKLQNLTVVVDVNSMQAMGDTHGILNLDPLSQRWRAFGWRTTELDGHDLPALVAALSAPPPDDCPHVILARTTIGKGVRFMENRLEWHYRNLDQDLCAAALEDVGGVH